MIKIRTGFRENILRYQGQKCFLWFSIPPQSFNSLNILTTAFYCQPRSPWHLFYQRNWFWRGSLFIFLMISRTVRCDVKWYRIRQFCELSDQVSTCSHEDTAVVLVKDVVLTQLRLQLRLDTRFSLNINWGFIWDSRIISPTLAKYVW